MALHNVDADAGALGRSLDHHGQGELCLNLGGQLPLHLIAVISMGTWGGNTLCHEDALGSGLVHGDSGSQHPGTSVGNAQHIQGSLQEAILTKLAMEGIEDYGTAGLLNVAGKGIWHQLHALCIIAFVFQGIQNSSARPAGNLGLSGSTAHHYNNFILVHLY